MEAEDRIGDEALFERFQQGVLSAFETLFARYRDKLLRFIQIRTRDHQSAEDVLQETFIRVFRDLRSIKLRGRFSTLLYTIARNLSLNRMRDDARKGKPRPLEHREETVDSAAGPAAAAEKGEALGILAEAVESLVAEQREVFVLRYEIGLSYQHISAILGVPKGTVKSRVFYAMQKVRQKVMRKYNFQEEA